MKRGGVGLDGKLLASSIEKKEIKYSLVFIVCYCCFVVVFLCCGEGVENKSYVGQ